MVLLVQKTRCGRATLSEVLNKYGLRINSLMHFSDVRINSSCHHPSVQLLEVISIPLLEFNLPKYSVRGLGGSEILLANLKFMLAKYEWNSFTVISWPN